ncbi:PAS domain-containing protein, partial [Escherichia coli]
IGKNSYELYNNIEVADVLQKDINQVIETGKTSITEDKIIDVATGKYKYFSATRAPLYDKIGKIIGVIGTSIDITAEKELELRKNETQIFEYLEF